MSNRLGSDETQFARAIPVTSQELRERLYRGELFVLDATEESCRLVDAVQSAVSEAFADHGEPRTVAHRISPDLFFAIAGKLRKLFYKQPHFLQLVANLITSLNFSAERTGFDPARLRIVSPGGHNNPAAAAVYHGHRDTWYANPETMITWWIPFHDVDSKNSFCFFPEQFEQEVSNDSEIFDLERWTAKDDKKLIGWQDKKTGLTAQYPQLLEEPEGVQVPVQCRRGDILLFSGQHLHRTYKQNTDLSRISLDFRTVDLVDDQNGLGAPNVDNRSTGAWIKKFLTVADVLADCHGN